MKNLKFFLRISLTVVITLTSIQISATFAKPDKDNPVSETANLSSIGTVRALVIFAAFKDQKQDSIPSWADDIFNPDIPNSISHYYHIQSNAQHQITGEVVKKWYYANYFSFNKNVKKGTFIRSVLEQVDEDIDFSLYDNWSGDDANVPDGKVDMIFINMAENPWRSKASLEINDYPFYIQTNDSSGNQPIRIYSKSGTAQRYLPNFENQIAIMAHEYGHMLGLVDLYDLSYNDHNAKLDDRSAGIGLWGLMSEGYGYHGLHAMSEFCKAQLGWLPVVEITKNIYNLDVDPRIIYKMRPYNFEETEYFLISFRKHDNIYDEKLPSGLLIWHVDETQDVSKNENEFHKWIDLECADGLFDHMGYPSSTPNPISGGDNLDFWAKHYDDYNLAHHGNTFDSTDPFDGVRYIAFTPYTNPSSNGYDGDEQSKVSNFAITNIRPGGLCDILFNYWAGEIKEDVTWRRDRTPYYLGENISVPTGVTLTIEAGTEVNYNGYSLISTGGEIKWTDYVTSINESSTYPMTFSLSQNYPNPFNPSTTIAYSLAKDSHVKISVYNTLGQIVAVLADEHQSKGPHIIHWDSQNQPSGVYIYRLEADGYAEAKKMFLQK